MNFSLFNLALFGAGALLIAAAIQDKNPRDIIATNLSGALKPAKPTEAQQSAIDDEGNRGPARDHNDGAVTGTTNPTQPKNYVVTSP